VPFYDVLIRSTVCAEQLVARLLKERCAAPLVIKADIAKVADIQRMFVTIKSQYPAWRIAPFW
jgi:hypothetical protein